MMRKDAVPTEYKGVLYRSKSEAMFARWIELNNEEIRRLSSECKGAGFEYEPDGMVVDGWTPDFLRWEVYSTVNSRTGLLIPTMFYSVIEYKPSEPTESYLRVLSNRFVKLNEMLSFYTGFCERALYYCYYGSVFNSKRSFLVMEPCSACFPSWIDCEEDWLISEEDEVRKTRFDLVQA